MALNYLHNQSSVMLILAAVKFTIDKKTVDNQCLQLPLC
jgi:hypothetical protein